MITIGFSTVACPDWTLDRVAQFAGDSPFNAVELRSFGVDSRSFGCDPALTAPGKVRRLFAEAGVDIACVATSIRFDQPIWPPVIGTVISDTEVSVREGKRAVDLAGQIGCPYVRVFAHDVPTRESRGSAIGRILKRLGMVVDHARNTPVRVLLENGGSFRTAADLAELIEAVDEPICEASYSFACGHDAGDDVDDVARILGGRLALVRVKDLRAGQPCKLGEGDVPVQGLMESLSRTGFSGTVIYEWDRAWFEDLAPAEEVLADACHTLVEWLSPAPASGTPAPAYA